MKVSAVSEDTILLEFGDAISEHLIPRIVAMERLIEERLGDLVVDLVPSYTTLLCVYDVSRLDHREIMRRLRLLGQDIDAYLSDAPNGKDITIPVWYDPEVGYDLEALAAEKGLTVSAVIEKHSAKRYQVFAVGFNPGFAFLGKVDPAIATARHSTPRKAVAPGSVGIADEQTAIYPLKSPGGWQIIGRSPAKLFDPSGDLQDASLLQVGDQVQFQPIDRAQFIEMGGQL